MINTNYLVLTQYRESSEYNDFIGKYYHFPAHDKKNYSSLFKQLPIEFVYYEPEREGKGEFFGYGKIINPPFKDKRKEGFYFVEISEYKKFSKPVYFKNDENKILEQIYSSEFYNAQNAVRKTTEKFVKEICLDGGILLNFRADAHLMQVLGEELIATEKVGLLELIKNSYDAHASFCNVYIEKIPGLSDPSSNKYKFSDLVGPIVVIEDDGIGMDWNAIENGWLRPASTIKTQVKTQLKIEREEAIKNGKLGVYDALVKKLQKEHKGRIPLGEKGVGRFATRRLGKKVTIRTKTKELDYEYVLRIDWDLFDNKVLGTDIDLDSVGISLFREKPARDYGEKGSGTQIIISEGRAGFSLDSDAVREINRTILQLRSPFKSPDNFNVFLFCPQIIDLDQDLITDEFDANFILDGLINEDGVVDFELKFNPPKSTGLQNQIFRKNNLDLKIIDEDDKPYWFRRMPECGPFFIHLNIWYRTSPWVDGPKAKELFEYLERYGGVTIYKDGLSIFSSEVGTKIDWLDLSVSHIKSGANLSYYNFLGNIDLNQTSNINLVDKTNREGMLQNTPFDDLSKLTRSIILYVQNYFKEKRNDLSKLKDDIITEPKKVSEITKQMHTLANVMADGYDLKKDPLDLINKIGKAAANKEYFINLAESTKKLQKSLNAMEEVRELLTEQAGYGLAVAISVHEISKLTSDFYNQVLDAVKNKKWTDDKLKELNDSADALKTELRRLGPLRAVRTEPRVQFNILKSIKFALGVHKRKLEKENIKIIFSEKDGFDVYCRFGALNQVFSNLLSNSRYWIVKSGQKEKIISIQFDKEYRTVIFADNGDDIDQSIKSHLFQPGYSLKDPPSGLGLYICKYYLNDMKGDIYLAPPKDRISELGGAQFILDFHKVSKNEEQTVRG